MKKFILDSCINSIKKTCPEYSDNKLLEIRYGLEGIYLSITKCIIILICTLILGIVKEMLTILVLYTVLRTFGFGLHAKKSWICLVSSLIVFVLVPLMCIHFVIPKYIKIFICALCVICFYLYAPSDTEKHPLIKRKRRMILKFITVCISIIYTFLCLKIKDNFLSNSLMFAMIIESILICPITYKIFDLRYNNYKYYITNS